MIIKFDSNLEFQKEAIESITGIFEGQEVCQANFTVLKPKQEFAQEPEQYIAKSMYEAQGFFNKLSLTEEQILENVQKIQLRNGLKQTKKIDPKDLNFTVEMETGTGKTYVYLRSIFELNKLYGFTKFIIVVPSLAIKEGTNKSLEITKEHFKGLYDNTNYDFFTYDSQQLEQVRSFTTSDYIQIMVINIDAFRKSFKDPEKEDKSNIIHRYNDKLGYAPIELIQGTNPIVIIDEPQSVDNTPKSKEAISSLNALCCLRYSATHREKYNMMYKLDSVDAYEKKLVKQIEVSSLAVKDEHNKPYLKLLKVDNKKSPITAQIEIDVAEKKGVKRTKKSVKQNSDLAEITKREIYSGYIINDIYCEKGQEYIDFTSQNEVVRLGETIGGIDDLLIKRKQIAITIEKHLDKELILNPQGIKVLSLFFIDKVANYRFYDEDKNPQKGRYAKIFDDEYKRIASKPKYHTLFDSVKDIAEEAEAVHNGYFSIDPKGNLKDTRGDTLADNDTYSLIMKDKEKLLSFDSKLRFIFSHSTLKEGWDNPNIFQICTLNETTSEMKKRQEIGRGLRLCVNQDGERIHGFEVNNLTVIANESYTDFVAKLQKEIEADTGVRFGVLDSHSFANIIIGLDGDNPQYLGQQKSEELWNFYKLLGYIDEKNKVQDKLRTDLRENNLNIPEEFKAVKGQIIKQLKRVAGNLNIKNADNKKQIKVNKRVLLSPAFKTLWDKIKFKTTYQVNFDTEKLIEKCAEAISSNVVVGKGKFIVSSAIVDITRGGITVEETADKTLVIDEYKHNLPDIISYLQNETNLTRKTIYQILLKSNRLNAFKINPQKFIDQTIEIIKSQMRHFIVDGIKYQKIGDEHYYSQELFQEQELFGHLKQDMIESTKSPYDYVKYDSLIESDICQDFEKSENVKFYAKLPGWFKIDTPLGRYNPDWALLWEEDDMQKLYFVVETKSTLDLFERRGNENDKITCGEKHFEALENDVKFEVAKDFDNLRDKINKELVENGEIMVKPKKVFISHASEDKERFVLDFAKQLRVKGIDAWIDKWEMNPGDKLVDKIFNEGFKDIDAFIIVLSEFSINKKWVKEELETAVVQRIEKNTKLIPVIIDKDIKIPEVLKSTIWCKIEDLSHYENDLNLIVNSINGIYNKSSLGTPPKHITEEIYTIAGLTKIDTIVLKEICEIAMEQKHEFIIASDFILRVNKKYNISAKEIDESLQVLDRSNLIKISSTNQGIDNFELKHLGFEKYATENISFYKDGLSKIAYYIVNHNLPVTHVEISNNCDINEYLAKHLIEVLRHKSCIRVEDSRNWLIVREVYPELKRYIETQNEN